MNDEFYFNARALALPDCPYCDGNGHITRRLDNGAFDYRVCRCAIWNQHRIAAEMRIKRLLPGRLGRMRFKNYDTGGDLENQQALDVAKRFVDNWATASKEGWILGFYGDMGSGKTHLTASLTAACVKRYMVKPYFLSVPMLADMQRETFTGKDEDGRGGNDSPMRSAIEADLLVLDDIGAEYRRAMAEGTNWVEELLYKIVDERIIHDRPIIYTTNYNVSQMKKLLGGRVLDRLRRNAAIEPLRVVQVPGASDVNKHRRDLLLGIEDKEENDKKNEGGEKDV